jgi:ABC-type spermidine/putrescine transport system permease subunit II
MSSTDERLARLTFATVPITIVAVGCGLSLLPMGVVGGALGVLTAWLTVSIPVGVLVGHCVLSDSDP